MIFRDQHVMIFVSPILSPGKSNNKEFSILIRVCPG
jgi:hypothetical protein